MLVLYVTDLLYLVYIGRMDVLYREFIYKYKYAESDALNFLKFASIICAFATFLISIFFFFYKREIPLKI